jgi:hypothetical protein
VSSVENDGDASTGQPMPLTLEYVFERIRDYVVHQPAGDVDLVVSSTDPDDTTQTITAEDEGAATSASATLDGDNLVVLAGPFGSLDAVRLDADTVGDVEVAINDGDATTPVQGAVLATLRGRDHYSSEGETNYDGDFGVPLLGAGSHAGAIGTGYEHFIGDSITRASGQADIGPRLNSASFSVDNNIETTEDASGRVMAIDVGTRDTAVEASVAGPKATHAAAADHLAATKGEIEWVLAGGPLYFPAAVITEPGEKAPEAEQAAMYVDDTFSSEGISLTSGA